MNPISKIIYWHAGVFFWGAIVVFQGEILSQQQVNYAVTTATQTQVEPTIAVSPVNPQYMMAAWMDYRTGVSLIGRANSTNGGATWNDLGVLSTYDGFTTESDPSIVADLSDQNTFYLTFLPSNSGGGNPPAEVRFLKTTNLGSDWAISKRLDVQVDLYADKPSIAIDQSNSANRGNLYLVWVDLRNSEYHIVCRHSTNRGVDWSDTAHVDDGNEDGVAMPNIAVGSSGNLYIAYTAASALPAYRVFYFSSSTNAGIHFGTPVQIRTEWTFDKGGPQSMGGRLTTNPTIVANPISDHLYICWNGRTNVSAPFKSDLWVIASTDQGNTWASNPINIITNSTTQLSTGDQYMPALAVNPSGTITNVLFFDSQQDPQNLLVYSKLVSAVNDANAFLGPYNTSTSNFQPNNSLIPGQGVFFGDYAQVADLNGTLNAIWPDTRSWNNPQSQYADIYSAPVAETAPYLYGLNQWAASNQVTATSATQYNSQRKLYLDSNNLLYEVFESGGEVFFNKSTDGGTTWGWTTQLSNGSGGNSAPCVTMSGTAILATWQQPSGSASSIVLRRSTNGGVSWSNTVTFGSVFPPSLIAIPTVSGYSTGKAFVAWRAGSNLQFVKSTDYGATWSSASAIPSTGSTYNSPSSAMYTTYWSVDQVNIAYATDVRTGSPHINCTYYEPAAGTWGTVFDLSSIIPNQYSQHSNPSLAVSGNTSYRTVHVAWDALNMSARVIVHRKGSFRAFGSDYSIIQYQSEERPSISGLNQDSAWMVFQNYLVGGIWRCHYVFNGSVWQWDSLTYVSSGFNPQFSVGSLAARYVWTDGTGIGPNLISASQRKYTKSTGVPAFAWQYSRELNVIDPVSGSDLSIDVGTPQILRLDKSVDLLSFNSSAAESTQISFTDLLSAGTTAPFVLGSDADTINFQVSATGNLPGQMFQSPSGSFAFQLVNKLTGAVVSQVGLQQISQIGDRLSYTISIPVRSLASSSPSSQFVIRPVITGLNLQSSYVVSLGHVYRMANSPTNKYYAGPQPSSGHAGVPTDYAMLPNYPNPFNPVTVLQYYLPVESRVRLAVYNTLGEAVKTLADETQSAGYHTDEWNADGLASGVYFSRLDAISRSNPTQVYTRVQKMVLAK